jgi:hypothetical protein
MFIFRLFTICSVRVSALVIVLSDNPCERIGKWETFSDFARGQIVDVRLARASVTKTVTLLCVSRTTVSKIMPAYTNHGKTVTSVKRNSGQKSTLTIGDRRTLRRIVRKITQLLQHR